MLFATVLLNYALRDLRSVLVTYGEEYVSELVTYGGLSLRRVLLRYDKQKGRNKMKQDAVLCPDYLHILFYTRVYYKIIGIFLFEAFLFLWSK